MEQGDKESLLWIVRGLALCLTPPRMMLIHRIIRMDVLHQGWQKLGRQ